MLTHTKLKDRKKRAELIIADAISHKVCEGCESIIHKKALLCPSCHGYRFDESNDRVVDQAKILGSRLPLSLTAQDYQ